MLTEQQIELAHPEAFDFAFGTLPTAEGVTFIRHLTGCRHCRAVVDEYSEIGGIIKNLPPGTEPPADLEDRTVAAMTAALAGHKAEPGKHPDAAEHDTEDRAVTRIYPKPERKPPAERETQVLPVPQPGPSEDPEPRPEVTHLPVRRRHRSRLVAVVAAAAAIVLVVAGSSWGVYSRVAPGQPAKGVSGPRIAGPGEFSQGGAVRRPQTLQGPIVTPQQTPVVAHPDAAAKPKTKPATKSTKDASATHSVSQ